MDNAQWVSSACNMRFAARGTTARKINGMVLDLDERRMAPYKVLVNHRVA